MVVVAAAVVLLVAWGAAGAPQGLPRDFEWGKVEGPALDYPMDFDFLPRNQANRMLIAEKKGVIRLAIGGVIQTEPFLDISHQVHSRDGARGLISIAVDTDFATHRFVYCLFAYETSPVGAFEGMKVGRLSRFRVNANLRSADPDSEVILIGSQIPQGDMSCPPSEQLGDIICLTFAHLLGGIDMDSSGGLYISIGDNSVAGNPGDSVQRAQVLGTMHAKILRVNRNGKAPPSNPWYDGDNTSNTSRTFALGFRNGFRVNYDERRGGLWLGDVGQRHYEEVNFVQAGRNYGWPCRQGPLDQFQFAERFPECDDMLNNAPPSTTRVVGIPTSPTIAYDHDVGAAITGMAPLTSTSWPEKYRNALFYVDYVEGWMLYNTINASGTSTAGPFPFAENLEGPVQIREGPDGCLWYLSLNSQEVFNICYVEDTSLPAVRFVSPPPAKKNVELSVPFVVYLSKPVKPSTVSDSIFVTRVDSGARVAGTTTYDEDRLTITFVPSKLLTGVTQYRLVVRGLEDNGGRKMAQNYLRTFNTRRGFSLYVSDLTLDRATSGAGRPVLLDQAKVNVPIHLEEVRYTKGISVIPASDLFFDIPASCNRMQGLVGIDDSSQALEDVGIQVSMRIDGAGKFSIISKLGRRMKAGDPPIPFDLIVKGLSRVEIRVRGNRRLTSQDTIIAFADLKFRCGTFDWKGPNIVSVSPPNGATGVPQNPQATVRFSESVDIESLATGVTVTDMETKLPISWEVASPNGLLNRMVIDTGALEYSRGYEITFNAGVKDLAGNAASDQVTSFVWKFTTEAEPVEPTNVDVVEELPITRIKQGGSFTREGFPRTIAPGLQTYPKGLYLTTTSEAVFDLSALGGRECSSFKAVAGMDAALDWFTKGSCVLLVSSEDTTMVDYRRVFEPREVSAALNVSLKAGQTELRVKANKSAATGMLVDCLLGNARLECDRGTIPISQLSMTSSTGTVSIDREPNNDPLRLLTASSTYDHGFVAGPDLKIKFDIPHPSCTKFRGTLQMDSDASVDGAKMIVRGLTGEEVHCESQQLRKGIGPVPWDCDITGREHLQLRFLKQGNLAGEHLALLTDAYLECDTRARRPRCEIAPVANNFVVGDELHFRANAVSFAGIPLPASAIRWDVSLIHCAPECHVHPEMVLIGHPEGSITVPDHGDYFYFNFNCVVEDDGYTSRSQRESFPKTAFVNLRSQPPGVIAVVGTFAGTTPLQATTVIGSTFPVDVKRNGPNGYTFSHWAHDGSTNPSFQGSLSTAADVTFTAIYTRDT